MFNIKDIFAKSFLFEKIAYFLAKNLSISSSRAMNFFFDFRSNSGFLTVFSSIYVRVFWF